MTRSVILLVAAVAAAAPAPGPTSSVEIRVINADGRTLASASAAGTKPAAAVKINRKFLPGDRIAIKGSPHMVVRLDTKMPQHMIYCPGGTFDFAVPTGKALAPYAREYFRGESHEITARPATPEEIKKTRNVALNIYDALEAKGSFPHASASNHYKTSTKNGMSQFAPRNAIDGETKNARHGGWPWQCWGPEKRKDLWFRIDFGRPVRVDKVALVMRAQFPPQDKSNHDDVFQSSTLVFSDGSKEQLKFRKTGDKQEFPFAARTVTWVKFTDLVLPESGRWTGFVEVEVTGRDADKTAPRAAKSSAAD